MPTTKTDKETLATDLIETIEGQLSSLVRERRKSRVRFPSGSIERKDAAESVYHRANMIAMQLCEYPFPDPDALSQAAHTDMLELEIAVTNDDGVLLFKYWDEKAFDNALKREKGYSSNGMIEIESDFSEGEFTIEPTSLVEEPKPEAELIEVDEEQVQRLYQSLQLLLQIRGGNEWDVDEEIKAHIGALVQLRNGDFKYFKK